MRFAAIADIHGNRLALEAVLTDIAACGITDIVNLGDHLSGPLEARRTAELLMSLDFVSIRGDQDRRMVEHARTGQTRRSDLDELDPRHVAWMAAMPTTLYWRDDIFLCHGSPRDDAAYLLDHVTSGGTVRASTPDEIALEATDVNASLILCAHTHIPRIVRLDDGRTFVNPGSVGLPAYEYGVPVPHKVETGTPDACYAVLERSEGEWGAQFRYVPYDARAMADLAQKNGQTWWAHALATGRMPA